MTTVSGRSSPTPRPGVTPASVGGAFLEALASQDFDRLASVLSDDVRLRALLPAGPSQWEGVDEIKARFIAWFGDADGFELVDSIVGDIGPRLYLRWRVRMQAQRLGHGWFVVEQQAYADTDDDGRVRRLSLLCSGYLPEAPGG